MGINEKNDLIDDSPENRVIRDEEAIPPKRSWLSTIILSFVLMLCILGFSYGLYKVLH